MLAGAAEAGVTSRAIGAAIASATSRRFNFAPFSAASYWSWTDVTPAGASLTELGASYSPVGKGRWSLVLRAFAAAAVGRAHGSELGASPGAARGSRPSEITRHDRAALRERLAGSLSGLRRASLLALHHGYTHRPSVHASGDRDHPALGDLVPEGGVLYRS